MTVPDADQTPDCAAASKAAEPRWQVILIFSLMMIALHLAVGPRVVLSRWHVSPTQSHALMEARAWRAGRLDIPTTTAHPEMGHGRPRDTAYHDGKLYNVFPPLFTFLCYAAMWLQELQGVPQSMVEQVFPPWYVGLVALTLPCVAFWAFRVATGKSAWAAVLTGYLILGTPILPMLAICANGSVNEVNHVLSSVGLLLIAGDLLGKRRIWPSALGLLMGIWTRQLTLLYVVAIVWIIWRCSSHRRRDLAIVAAAVALGLGVTGGLNHAKFGSVFDTGYRYIYHERYDLYADRYREYGSIFDVRFVRRNLWHMNLELPSARESQMQVLLEGHGDGASIWFTSPLLLLALWNARRWWRDPPRRALMLASLLVIFGFLCYHNSGSVQRGYFRFALDFIPVWMVVFAPYVFRGRQPWFALGCLAWSALYFRTLPPS